MSRNRKHTRSRSHRRSTSRQSPSRRARAVRRQFETLEERTVLATLFVTTLADTVADDGELSLREAVSEANTNGEDDEIMLPAGDYTLSIVNSSGQENAAEEGDLDLTQAGHSFTLRGMGPGAATCWSAARETTSSAFPAWPRSVR